MISLTTMTMQFIDNEPDGVRICRVEAESLVTVVVPRDMLSEAKQLPGIPKRGVYYLLDEDHGVISRIYAGQTTQGLRRLDSHKSKKEFWSKAVMFLDDEMNIDRDVLDALEAKVIEYVRTHGSYEADNSDTPQPYVNPYKEQAVERLHASILFRMAALGFDLNRTEPFRVPDAPLFHTKKNGIVATGRYSERDGSFTVLSGSQINLSRPILKCESATKARQTIFGDVTGIAELREDLSFTSPSTAAVFALGGSQNGWKEWVDEQGRTLNDVYRGNQE